jgi:sugar phosphate isomerase/epimerase
MNLRFACADFTFPLLSHENSLDVIQMLGFNGVDIGLFQDRSHIQLRDALMDVAGTARMLREKLASRNLVPADLFLQTALDFESTAINHPAAPVRGEVREAFLKTLELAQETGSAHVTILPGVVFEQEGQLASYERTVEELKWRTDQALQRNLILGIEAHIGSICDTPEKAAALIDDVAGLTLTLDYTHFTKSGYEDGEIENLIPLASHFHARGANGSRAQTTFNTNTIDYARVVRKMVEFDYSGFIGIEYVWSEWENMNEVDNISESIILKNYIQREFEKITKDYEKKELT